MLDWLDKQRRRPKEARRRVAFTIAAVTTVVIVLLWSVSLPARFSNNEGLRMGTANGNREMFEGFNTLLEEGRNELRDTARQLEVPTSTNPEPAEEPASKRMQIQDRSSAFDTTTFDSDRAESDDARSPTSTTDTP